MTTPSDRDKERISKLTWREAFIELYEHILNDHMIDASNFGRVYLVSKDCMIEGESVKMKKTTKQLLTCDGCGAKMAIEPRNGRVIDRKWLRCPCCGCTMFSADKKTAPQLIDDSHEADYVIDRLGFTAETFKLHNNGSLVVEILIDAQHKMTIQWTRDQVKWLRNFLNRDRRRLPPG